MSRNLFLALATLFLMGGTAVLTGCNTVDGAGKGIQLTGKSIQEETYECR